MGRRAAHPRRGCGRGRSAAADGEPWLLGIAVRCGDRSGHHGRNAGHGRGDAAAALRRITHGDQHAGIAGAPIPDGLAGVIPGRGFGRAHRDAEHPGGHRLAERVANGSRDTVTDAEAHGDAAPHARAAAVPHPAATRPNGSTGPEPHAATDVAREDTPTHRSDDEAVPDPDPVGPAGRHVATRPHAQAHIDAVADRHPDAPALCGAVAHTDTGAVRELVSVAQGDTDR